MNFSSIFRIRFSFVFFFIFGWHHGHQVKQTLKTWIPGVRFLFNHLPPIWLMANYLTFLGLSLFISKVGMRICISGLFWEWNEFKCLEQFRYDICFLFIYVLIFYTNTTCFMYYIQIYIIHGYMLNICYNY